MADQRYSVFEVAVWYGLAVPRDTAKPIFDKLNSELQKAARSDNVRTIFAAQGGGPLGISKSNFDRFFVVQDAKWAPFIQKAGIKAE